jgi:hypothetical protein
MLELVTLHPWLIAVALGLAIPILGVVFGTTTTYMLRVRQAELDAALKQDMLQRGMSAEEIRTVIESSSYRKRKHCAPDGHEVA